MMSTVRCPTYDVHRTMSTVRCPPYDVIRTMSTVQCPPYNVQCTMSNVQCPTYNVHRTMATSCQVGSVTFRVKSDSCQAAPMSCRVKSAPCPLSAGRAVSDRGVSACPCHVGATLQGMTTSSEPAPPPSKRCISGRAIPFAMKTLADHAYGRFSLVSCVYCNLRHRWLRGLTRKPLGHAFLAGTAPWSGLDPSQRLRNGPGMLLDQVSRQTVDSGPDSGHFR